MTTYIFRLPVLLLFAFALIHQPASAQDQIKGLKQKLEFNINELGDADIALTMKLNASQWDMFKRSVGNNTANLKREMIKGLPKFFLTDFKYEEDQMERTYTLRMKANAVATVDRNGKWKADLDAKDPDIMKVNDREFKLTANYLSGGGLVEQTQQIYLPSNAKNAKVEKDSFGKALLTYQTGAAPMSLLFNIGGIILMLSGVGLFVFNSIQARRAIS